MGDKHILFKITDRYGPLGYLAIGLSLSVFILAWIFLSVAYPVAFIIPVLIAGWMAWNVTRGRND